MNSPSTLLRQLMCQSCVDWCEGHNKKFLEIFRNETTVKLLLIGKRPTPTLTFHSILWILTDTCLFKPSHAEAQLLWQGHSRRLWGQKGDRGGTDGE